MKTQLWAPKLEALIEEKHMLKTGFYQAWTAGELSAGQLARYARGYYPHVEAFPTYLSALHSRSRSLSVRRHLLQNLIDEEAGDPNHPDLWRAFAKAMGVTDQELSGLPDLATQTLIEHFRETCHKGSVAQGIAALYAYESQMPAICPQKVEGLKRWYGITDPKAYHYFTVHETADVEHSAVERALLEEMVDPDHQEEVLATVDQTLTQLGCFLDSFL